MITFIVCLLAGLGAGLGTGFAGMSAAAVISPMLIAFLHMDAYQAIGIALASAVLASAVSAYTYDFYLYRKLSGKLYPKHDHGRFLHIHDDVTRY